MTDIIKPKDCRTLDECREQIDYWLTTPCPEWHLPYLERWEEIFDFQKKVLTAKRV